MQKRKKYLGVWFKAEVIREAWLTLKPDEIDDKESTLLKLSVKVSDAPWFHDNEEEFFADYRNNLRQAAFFKSVKDCAISLHASRNQTEVAITAPNRVTIENVFHIFEENVEVCKLPPKEKQSESPIVFIGHGRSTQWRDLKDHLHDKHNIKLESYEVGARAGHAIRDILQDMIAKSSFAVLVMTAEDTTAEGTVRARQNVIHEIGLFQGKLGYSRAIVLIEQGTEEFSNIHGIQQIRFSKGNIKETFGEVLATIKREFGAGSI